MKKVFLSLPMSGRTQEDIEFTIDAMTKKAKEILGEDVEVIHLANIPKAKVDNLANPGIYNMVLATAGMLHCDYFMGFSNIALNLLGTVTHSRHDGCRMEEELWTYSQRHNENGIININGNYINKNRLLILDWHYNISEFIPELGTKELKVRGTRSKIATIDDIVDGKEEKDRFVTEELKDVDFAK